MAQSQPDRIDLLAVVDSFNRVKDTIWLVQSIQDAISRRWDEPDLINHVAYLLDIYIDKVNELMPELEEAIDKVKPESNFKNFKNFIINGKKE